MAEAFLRKHGGDMYEAHSAGLEPKGLHPLTLRVMEEVGVDMSGQTSKGIEVYWGKNDLQYLITVCDDANENCPAGWQGGHARMNWSFEDPARFEGTEEQRLEKFREVRDRIEQKILRWLE